VIVSCEQLKSQLQVVGPAKMSRSTCLGQDLSIRKYKYRAYIALSPVKLYKAARFVSTRKLQEQEYLQSAALAFSSLSNELQGTFLGLILGNSLLLIAGVSVAKLTR
jgi:hypothetical protein